MHNTTGSAGIRIICGGVQKYRALCIIYVTYLLYYNSPLVLVCKKALFFSELIFFRVDINDDIVYNKYDYSVL